VFGLWFVKKNKKNGISINDELANGEFVQANAELCFIRPLS
jgi:hypothetical protein